MIDWEYSGGRGPENWHRIKEDYRLCKEGCCQTPVDLTAPVEVEAAKPTYHYAPFTPEVTNAQWTVSIVPPSGNVMTLEGKPYELIELHFHVPGEHTVDGLGYDGELHLVHSSRETGQLCVVGVMMMQGERNYTLDKIWSAIPENAGHTRTSKWTLNLNDFLPTKGGLYRYAGSLSRPPCSEGVEWLIYEDPIKFSVEQGRSFLSVIGPNARPLQPLNDRTIEYRR